MLRASLVCALISVIATPSLAKPRRSVVAQADAASRRTTQAVAVRKKPAAKAPVLGKLSANTVVLVEGEQGEWLRVRARLSGRRGREVTGYVPRGSVTAPPTAIAPEPDEEASEADFTPAATTDPRQTMEEVVVRKKPGEKQASVGTLPAGTQVVVEAEKGRWLRIRAGKISGYLARTTVTGPTPATNTAVMPAQPAATDAAPTSRWGNPTGTGDPLPKELVIEVTAASALRNGPLASEAAVAEVARGAKLAVLDATTAAGWIRVRDERGQIGWIQRASVGNGSAGIAITGSIEDTRAKPASAPPWSIGERTAFAIRIDAGIGYRVLGMDFTSNGAGGLANYEASADASAADLDVDITVRPSRRLVVGLDVQVGGSRSSPGLDYPGPSGPPGDIPFSTFVVDAGVRAGLRARDIFEISARAGGHYDTFFTTDVENAGMLPRERLLGATLGARVDIVPRRSRVSATLRVDALAIGNRLQTPGLEDGASSKSRAVWTGVTARFQLGRRLALQGAYDFGRVTTEWSGMSIRDPGVTSARRVDSTQLVQIGLSVGL